MIKFAVVEKETNKYGYHIEWNHEYKRYIGKVALADGYGTIVFSRWMWLAVLKIKWYILWNK